jgi:hypothetical protein
MLGCCVCCDEETTDVQTSNGFPTYAGDSYHRFEIPCDLLPAKNARSQIPTDVVQRVEKRSALQGKLRSFATKQEMRGRAEQVSQQSQLHS